MPGSFQSVVGPTIRTNTPLWLLLALLSASFLTNTSAAETPKERGLRLLRERYQTANSVFCRRLLQVADYCQSHGFSEEASLIRSRAKPFDDLKQEIDQLPEAIIPEPSLALPPFEREWRLQFLKTEADYAAELYKISRDALKSQSGPHPSFAFSLIREVAFRDPNHKLARETLGFVREGDLWTTPFAKRQKARKYVDHPTFGWIREIDVPRYEAGERYFQGKWMPAAREAAIRSDFQYAWAVETEHFVIRTNHSLEAGVQIGRQLERFHQFFLREFAAFFNTASQMQALFDKGKGSSLGGQTHEIHYFRSREEYIRRLQPQQPNIAITNGLYVPSDRIAYLYHDPEAPGHMATIYHEVTHQLLGETTRTSFDVGENAHFWIIEGFACYIETVRDQAGQLTIGTPFDDRIYWARRRVVDENFYIPMEQFTSLGKDAFRAQPNLLPQFYSQAAGMAHFFLHYQEGVYRDAFIEHLSQVYSPVDRTRYKAAGLDKVTGVSFADLDLQYRDYMQSLPVDPAITPAQ